MKFEIKDSYWGGYNIFSEKEKWLIWLGDICLKKENKKNKSCSNQNSFNFDYHGIQNALCSHYYFTPKRILVIQMETIDEQKRKTTIRYFKTIETNKSKWNETIGGMDKIEM